MNTSFTQRQLRDAFGEFATGVTVVTAVRPDGEPVGITANSFSSVSLEPPLLLWCLSNHSSGAVAFAPGAHFAVHVLSHEQRELAVHFARRTADKFEVDQHWRADPQPPHLEGALVPLRLPCARRASRWRPPHRGGRSTGPAPCSGPATGLSRRSLRHLQCRPRAAEDRRLGRSERRLVLINPAAAPDRRGSWCSRRLPGCRASCDQMRPAASRGTSAQRDPDWR